jgi:hypothetical protein
MGEQTPKQFKRRLISKPHPIDKHSMISKTKRSVLKTWLGFLNLPFMDVIFVFGHE